MQFYLPTLKDSQSSPGPILQKSSLTDRPLPFSFFPERAACSHRHRRRRRRIIIVAMPVPVTHSQSAAEGTPVSSSTSPSTATRTASSSSTPRPPPPSAWRTATSSSRAAASRLPTGGSRGRCLGRRPSSREAAGVRMASELSSGSGTNSLL